MLMSTIIGFLLYVAPLSTLVVGDLGTVITINNATITNNANDYFEPWSLELIQTQKNTLVTGKLFVKKQLPDTMQFKFFVLLNDQIPIDYVTSLCDAMHDEVIGKSFVEAGVPKGVFQKECPVMPGNGTIEKWDPPSYLIPPGILNGPISGTIKIMEDGKEPYVLVQYEGRISLGFPRMGR